MDRKLVFISCIPADENLAKEISMLLTAYHIDSFVSSMAKSNTEKLESLQQMKILLLLFSKGTLGTSVIDNEVTKAINNRVPIVPFQVDETSIKEDLSFEFMLEKSQWVLGYPDRQKQMDNLIVSVCRFLGIDAIEKNPTDPFEQLKRGIALEYGTNCLSKDRKEAMLWLNKSASNGNALAMFELYKFHVNSEDENRYTNYNKAREWLIKAADNGLAEAQYILGTNYEVYDEHMMALYSCQDPNTSYPLKIKKDYGLARKYYIAASKQGHKKAIFRLGMLCIHGPKEMRDSNYAFQLLTMASDIDNQELWYELGNLYMEQGNANNAIACYLKSKSRGEYQLAKCYLDGLGTKKNIQKACEIVFNKEHFSDPRFLELKGDLLSEGIGVPPNVEEACTCYLQAYKYYISEKSLFYNQEKASCVLEKAANLNNAEANYKLGMLYFNNGDAYAYFHFMEAADKDLPIAKLYLGYCFYYGIGIGKDYNLAFYWLKQADIPGLAFATYLLGKLYLNGLGTNKNEQKALDCFYRAANQNNAEAENTLAELYKQGKLVMKDDKLSQEYYERALIHGLKNNDENK